jgi:hypothetical protein
MVCFLVSWCRLTFPPYKYYTPIVVKQDFFNSRIHLEDLKEYNNVIEYIYTELDVDDYKYVPGSTQGAGPEHTQTTYSSSYAAAAAAPHPSPSPSYQP